MLPLIPQANPLKRRFSLQISFNKIINQTYFKGNEGCGVVPAGGITVVTVCC